MRICNKQNNECRGRYCFCTLKLLFQSSELFDTLNVPKDTRVKKTLVRYTCMFKARDFPSVKRNWQRKLAADVYSPLDGMLVHRRVYPPNIKYASIHLYTWVERGTVRVKCLAQETQHDVPGQGSNLDHSIQRQAR